MDTHLADEFWDETSDGIVATTPDDRALYWNRAAEAIFAYDSVQALDASLASLISPPDRLDDQSRINVAVSDREPAVDETVCRRSDGSLLQVSVSTKRVRDSDGDLRYILSIYKDVSPLKVSRDSKLAQSESGELLESLPDAVVMVNVTDSMVLVNSHAERLFGFERATLLGHSLAMLLPSRLRPRNNAEPRNFFADPKPRTLGLGFDLHGLRNNGEEFPVEIRLSPVLTEAGTMLMCAVRDIAGRRRVEQKFRGLLESAPDGLVIVGRDGRIALVNSRLEGLFGYQRSELLGEPVDMLVPQRLRERHSAHRATFFTQSRARNMGEGRQLYGLRKDGSELQGIDAVNSVLSPLAQSKDVAVHYEVAPELALVTLDRYKFIQILYKLPSNGIKFNKDGGRIRINARGGTADGLTLSVEDSGMGIDPKDFSKLFVEFEQLDSGASRKVGGTGLGLALTKKIIEFQGGPIRVESQLGGGSRFIVSLPLLSNAQQHALRIA